MKVLFLLGKDRVRLLVPHFKYDTLIDVPVSNLALEVVKGLCLFVRVLGDPVLLSYKQDD